jgi:hypothetical protein
LILLIKKQKIDSHENIWLVHYFWIFLFNYITIKMDICKKNNYLNAIKSTFLVW